MNDFGHSAFQQAKPKLRAMLLSAAALLTTFHSALFAAEFQVGERTLFTSPAQPMTGQPLVISTPVSRCEFVQVNRLAFDLEDKTISVALGFGSNDFAPCTPVLVNVPVSIALDSLSESAIYTFKMYEQDAYEEENFFDPEDYIGEFELSIVDTGRGFVVETPAPGSLQSGIGVVRGWACEAESIEVSFNDEPRLQIAYGSSRPDTREICGDENNGYGLVTGWGNLGPGTHRMRTYIDGIEVSNVEFEVAGLNEPFIRGLSGSYELEGFPEAGRSVTIEWSEPEQNFIITDSKPRYNVRVNILDEKNVQEEVFYLKWGYGSVDEPVGSTLVRCNESVPAKMCSSIDIGFEAEGDIWIDVDFEDIDTNFCTLNSRAQLTINADPAVEQKVRAVLIPYGGGCI